MISTGYNIVFLFILLIFTPTVRSTLIRLEQILHPVVAYVPLNVDNTFLQFTCSVFSSIVHIDTDHLDPVHPLDLYTYSETRHNLKIIQILYSKVRFGGVFFFFSFFSINVTYLNFFLFLLSFQFCHYFNISVSLFRIH